jgi:hypothetical protein
MLLVLYVRYRVQTKTPTMKANISASRKTKKSRPRGRDICGVYVRNTRHARTSDGVKVSKRYELQARTSDGIHLTML